MGTGANTTLYRDTSAAQPRSVSLVVVTICTGLFLLLALLDVLRIFSRNQAAYVLGLSYDGVVHSHLLFQFLTSPFLHGSVSHLAFNMLAVWMLGPDIELALGRPRYLLLSTLSALASLMGFLCWNWGNSAIGFGYSGVVFGLLVAQARLFPDRTLYIYALFPLRMKHAALVLGAVEILFLISPGQPSTAPIAHLSGAVASWLYLRATAHAPSHAPIRSQPSPGKTGLFPVRRGHDIPLEL